MSGVAVIGAGRIGQIHAENVYRQDGARLLYVSDVVADAAESLAGRFAANTASVEEIMNDKAVDAVVIASSTDTHAPLVELAAQHGKAIFCEKPLDLDTAAARQCDKIARQHKVLLCVGFNRRHDPSFNRLKDEIDTGSVGQVEVISITSRDPAPPPVDYIKRSGGLFRDMMIHDLDMARWLLGEEPVEVFASGSVFVDKAIADAGDIDTAVAVLRTGGGRLCQITNSRRCSYGYDQRIEVFGSNGMLRANNQTQTSVEQAGDGGFRSEKALPFFLERYADAYRIQLQRFLAVVDGASLALPNGEDGIRALQLADAAQASADSGKPVAL